MPVTHFGLLVLCCFSKVVNSTSLDYIIPSWTFPWQEPPDFCHGKKQTWHPQDLVKQMHDLTGTQIRQLVAKRAESRRWQHREMWRLHWDGGSRLLDQAVGCCGAPSCNKPAFCRIQVTGGNSGIIKDTDTREKTAALYMILRPKDPNLQMFYFPITIVDIRLQCWSLKQVDYQWPDGLTHTKPSSNGYFGTFDWGIGVCQVL